MKRVLSRGRVDIQQAPLTQDGDHGRFEPDTILPGPIDRYERTAVCVDGKGPDSIGTTAGFS